MLKIPIKFKFSSRLELYNMWNLWGGGGRGQATVCF